MGGMGLYNDFRAVMGFRTTSKTFLKKKNKKKNSSEMKTKANTFFSIAGGKRFAKHCFFLRLFNLHLTFITLHTRYVYL